MRYVSLPTRMLAPLLLVLPLACLTSRPAASQGQWTGDFAIPSFDGPTTACAVYRGQYVVAGNFRWAGETRASNVAVWDGSQWAELGGGLGSPVTHLAVSDTTLLAATNGYAPVAPLMRFDGTSWQPLGGNLFGYASALLVDTGTIYAAGQFYLSGSGTANRVVKWNGSSWDPVGGGFDGSVMALAVWNGVLFAGGEFLTSDSGYVAHIARWNGAHWVSVGGGTEHASAAWNYVAALAVWQDRLYAAGYFTSAGGVAANGVASWDGSAWSALPNAPPQVVGAALEPEGGVLHVAGTLQTPNAWASGLIAFDGQAWTLPSAYPTWSIADVAIGDGRLIAVGNQSNLVQNGIARPTRNVLVRDPAWRDLAAWQPTMRGLLGPSWSAVYALQVHDGALYAGGYFDYAATPSGWTEAHGIARWDGDGWSTVPGGLYGWVNHLASWNGLLVAAGNISAPSSPSAVLASDGSEWKPVGDAPAGTLSGVVGALGEWQGALVAGGALSSPSFPGQQFSVMTNSGSGWQPLGGLLAASPNSNTAIRAFASFGGDLYVAGQALALAGVGLRAIARWDGSTWVDVPGLTAGSVNCMLLRSDGLWVGCLGSSQQGSVLRWNGSTWTDTGLHGFTVMSLVEVGGDLYAAGFGYAPGAGFATLARLHDGAWNTIPGGPEQTTVLAAAALAGDVFVGGPFTHIGSHPAEGLARWTPGPSDVVHAPLALSLGPNPATDHVVIRLTVAHAGRVRLAIHDLSGALVARPVDEVLGPGTIERTWSIPGGHALRPGVYFAKLTTPDGDAESRLVLIR